MSPFVVFVSVNDPGNEICIRVSIVLAVTLLLPTYKLEVLILGYGFCVFVPPGEVVYK